MGDTFIQAFERVGKAIANTQELKNSEYAWQHPFEAKGLLKNHDIELDLSDN